MRLAHPTPPHRARPLAPGPWGPWGLSPGWAAVSCSASGNQSANGGLAGGRVAGWSRALRLAGRRCRRAPRVRQNQAEQAIGRARAGPTLLPSSRQGNVIHCSSMSVRGTPRHIHPTPTAPTPLHATRLHPTPLHAAQRRAETCRPAHDVFARAGLAFRCESIATIKTNGVPESFSFVFCFCCCLFVSSRREMRVRWDDDEERLEDFFSFFYSVHLTVSRCGGSTQRRLF